MKMKKSIISFTLILCLAVCFMAMPMSAYAAGNGRAIQSGTACVADGDALYFGASATEWRVLDADSTNTGASGMFLLSEKMLGITQFEAAGNSDDGDGQTNPNDWQNSDAQKWCKDNFYSIFPTSAEQAAVLGVSKTDNAANLYRISWGQSALFNDYLFFLSAQEAYDYLDDGDTGLESSGYWWLRSPIAHNDNWAGIVNPFGFVCDYCVFYGDVCARPAFNLNLNSVLFTSAAAGGKSSGAVGAGAISEISAYSGTDWKLTLYDGSRSGFTAETTASNSGVLTIEYSGAAGGGNNYISAIIADGSGNYTHYGRLAAASASGSVKADLSGIDMSGKTLYIFNEQYNGDKMTDFSSQLVKVDLTVPVPGVPAPAADPNPYGVPSTGSERDTALMISLAVLSGSVLLFSLRRKKEA